MTSPCPVCGRPADPTRENKHRPFCSERCQLLDLGRWLDGSYAIPGEPADVPVAQPDDADGRDADN